LLWHEAGLIFKGVCSLLIQPAGMGVDHLDVLGLSLGLFRAKKMIAGRDSLRQMDRTWTS